LPEPRVDPTALFRAIVESADDAITSTDLQETITSWNQAAERLYGYSAAETIGKSNRMIIPPDRYAEEDAVVRKQSAPASRRQRPVVQHWKSSKLIGPTSSLPTWECQAWMASN
jgi:PAS domain S-box-containing protein